MGIKWFWAHERWKVRIKGKRAGTIGFDKRGKETWEDGSHEWLMEEEFIRANGREGKWAVEGSIVLRYALFINDKNSKLFQKVVWAVTFIPYAYNNVDTGGVAVWYDNMHQLYLLQKIKRVTSAYCTASPHPPMKLFHSVSRSAWLARQPFITLRHSEWQGRREGMPRHSGQYHWRISPRTHSESAVNWKTRRCGRNK